MRSAADAVVAVWSVAAVTLVEEVARAGVVMVLSVSHPLLHDYHEMTTNIVSESAVLFQEKSKCLRYELGRVNGKART